MKLPPSWCLFCPGHGPGSSLFWGGSLLPLSQILWMHMAASDLVVNSYHAYLSWHHTLQNSLTPWVNSEFPGKSTWLTLVIQLPTSVCLEKDRLHRSFSFCLAIRSYKQHMQYVEGREAATIMCIMLQCNTVLKSPDYVTSQSALNYLCFKFLACKIGS
jgi:hypothetical protein